MSWMVTRGTLTAATIAVGMRVVVHFAFAEDLTGTVQETDGHWADVDVDGYDGQLVVPVLVSECDRLDV